MYMLRKLGSGPEANTGKNGLYGSNEAALARP